MIKESTLWDPKLEERPDFVFDICDSQHQLTRIFTRPLTATTQELRSFGSFKGRGVAILHLGKILLRESFRLLKHLIVIIAELTKTILVLLNCPFSERARAQFMDRIKNATSSTLGLLMRPIAFALEVLRCLGAILVHPWMGILLEDKNP